MKPVLLVVNNFFSHVKGDLITDPKLIEQYLGDACQTNVMQITAEEPAPAAPVEAAEPTET